MAFSTRIILGTIGESITNVKLQECTGNGTGCTDITGYTNAPVSSFPLTITTINDDSTYIKVIALGTCTTSELISITGVPDQCDIPGGSAAITTFLPFTFTINNASSGTATLNFTDLANDDAILTYNTTTQITINPSTAVPLNLTMNSGVSTGQILVSSTNTNFAGFQIEDVPNQGDPTEFNISDITQWGTIQWKSLRFRNADDNLTISATDYPDLSDCVDLSFCFQNLNGFNDSNIISWNTSNVTNMRFMFNGGSSFNQSLSGWDVGNVTTMEDMFAGTSAFNQDISNWNVSSVTNMETMFRGSGFNNGGVALTWNTSTSNVTNMKQMFEDADSFNQDISSWDVSNVTDMGSMFYGNSGFNNGGVALTWSTGTSTSAVTNMDSMFLNATVFNQDISSWDVGNVTTMNGIFSNSGMSSTNYGLFLERCYVLATTTGVQSSVALGAGTIQYPASAVTARNYLTGTKGWTITDGGPV